MVIQHRKNNPSVGAAPGAYYIKNEFQQQQKKDGRDVNLSYSQGVKNSSGLELARGTLNNSRGNSTNHTSHLPNVNTSQVQPSTPGQANLQFRISPGLNNSREYSKDKRRHPELNGVHNGGNEEQIHGHQNYSNNHITNNISSRILISRNNSPKATLKESNENLLATGVLHSSHSKQPENVLLSGTRRAVSDQEVVKHAQEKIEDPESRHNQKQEPAEPTIIWGDNLNGEDIRTELKFGDCLGQGSFAKVYEGFDKRLKIPVAIKVIDKRKIKDNEVKKKALIEEELSICSKMVHPNIVKFIRLVEDVKRVKVHSLTADLHGDGAVWSTHVEHVLSRHGNEATSRGPVLQDLQSDRERCGAHAQYGIRSPRSQDDQHPHRYKHAGEDHRFRIRMSKRQSAQHVLRHAILHASRNRAERQLLCQTCGHLDAWLRAL